MIPAEEIVEQIKAKTKAVESLLSEITTLAGNLQEQNTDWDWISVKNASQLCDVSVGTIYAKINKGELKTKRIASKIFVSKKELEAVNDV